MILSLLRTAVGNLARIMLEWARETDDEGVPITVLVERAWLREKTKARKKGAALL